MVASKNKKKLLELNELLGDLPIELVELAAFPKATDVEEDGRTFRENAEKKARAFAAQTGCLTLSDDSGLCVDFLKGKPGVHSARFSGPEKDDLRNCEKLLELLRDVPDEKRTASFWCALALADSAQVLCVIEESVAGRITREMRGKNGFGYDPLFYFPGLGRTFAEISAGQKHSVSHRGKALCRMKTFLTEYLNSGG